MNSARQMQASLTVGAARQAIRQRFQFAAEQELHVMAPHDHAGLPAFAEASRHRFVSPSVAPLRPRIGETMRGLRFLP